LDQELTRMLRKSQKPVVLVINKIDSEKHENLAFDFASLGFSDSLSISAAHGRGISELIEAIDQLLPSPSATDQSPVTSRQSLSILPRARQRRTNGSGTRSKKRTKRR